MTKSEVKSMSADELWILHATIRAALITRISAAVAVLEDRLRNLNQKSRAAIIVPPRRPYPKVRPKFQNPEKPFETWAGRGKQPTWLKTQLKSGKRIDDFLISLLAA
jgi:DNA-binding protein H-NS